MLGRKASDWTKADLERLVAERFAENENLELKRDLPEDGEIWANERRLSNRSRERIAKEVAAFANTRGGTLILGISELAEPPGIAEALTPLRQCQLLKQRLADYLHTQFDPAIPWLEVHAILDVNNDEGFVVITVGGSPIAPHRLSSTREVFIRQGTNAVPIGMLETRQMILSRAGQQQMLHERLSVYHSRFAETVNNAWEPLNPSFGIQITSIPLFDVGLPRFQEIQLFSRRFRCRLRRRGTQDWQDVGDGNIWPRAVRITRGVRYHDPGEKISQCEMYTDGRCISTFVSQRQRGNAVHRFHSIVFAEMLFNSLVKMEHLRSLAGASSAPFSLQASLRTRGSNGMSLWTEDMMGVAEHQFYFDAPLPLVEVGDREEFPETMNNFFVDLYDSFNAPIPELEFSFDHVWRALHI